MAELARMLTGYAYILRNEKGDMIGLAYAPSDAVKGMTEEEINRLPIVTPMGHVIDALPQGQQTRRCATCKGAGKVYATWLGGIISDEEGQKAGSNARLILCPACGGKGY